MKRRFRISRGGEEDVHMNVQMDVKRSRGGGKSGDEGKWRCRRSRGDGEDDGKLRWRSQGGCGCEGGDGVKRMEEADVKVEMWVKRREEVDVNVEMEMSEVEDVEVQKDSTVKMEMNGSGGGGEGVEEDV